MPPQRRRGSQPLVTRAPCFTAPSREDRPGRGKAACGTGSWREPTKTAPWPPPPRILTWDCESSNRGRSQNPGHTASAPGLLPRRTRTQDLLHQAHTQRGCLASKIKGGSVSKECRTRAYTQQHLPGLSAPEISTKHKPQAPAEEGKELSPRVPTGVPGGLFSERWPLVPLHTLHSISHAFCLTWSGRGHRTAPSSKHKAHGLFFQGHCVN